MSLVLIQGLLHAYFVMDKNLFSFVCMYMRMLCENLIFHARRMSARTDPEILFCINK